MDNKTSELYLQQFQLLAKYNQALNQSFYQAASQLDEAALNLDRQAFFPSILATLNHLIVGDILWLKRFATHPSQLSALNALADYPAATSLEQIMYADLATLQQARFALDETIIEFCQQLTPEILVSPFEFKNMKGQQFSKAYGLVIHHLLNHQTHHRGQVSTLLFQAGVDVGVTDLLYQIPELT
ncbi:damage-inducible protein DinB [Saccharobesus litoralis]|uniref:Damage-inducible protein DinB n=1 Tax=Saccharobesus litoralis TaxID=2172099 RepID=A0A2S0VXK0_9ALTE|nr:DinB family protein [Saccharobesus litoralis]AWB68923.1 damage-inducible protein DinB [Saccharobesus litoralis]